MILYFAFSLFVHASVCNDKTCIIKSISSLTYGSQRLIAAYSSHQRTSSSSMLASAKRKSSFHIYCVKIIINVFILAIILKTYDSLTPFEKMILKCGSVLGDVFSRRMLLNLLQSDSPRKVAQGKTNIFSAIII